MVMLRCPPGIGRDRGARLGGLRQLRIYVQRRRPGTAAVRLRHKGAQPVMTLEQTGALPRLSDRSPAITGAEIADSLVPPSQFEHATFDSYRPDHDYPSQAEAVS